MVVQLEIRVGAVALGVVSTPLVSAPPVSTAEEVATALAGATARRPASATSANVCRCRTTRESTDGQLIVVAVGEEGPARSTL
jgi:hypothetical protein